MQGYTMDQMYFSHRINDFTHLTHPTFLPFKLIFKCNNKHIILHLKTLMVEGVIYSDVIFPLSGLSIHAWDQNRPSPPVSEPLDDKE